MLTPAPRIYAAEEQQEQPVKDVLEKWMDADVLYLGETHDRPEDHQAQLEILRSLHQQRPNLVIAMEMFQRPYQGVLDRFIAGEITEQELVDQSEYQKRWGFDWSLYAPILRFAQQHQLPVVALNTPTEVTRKVARTGLEGLTSAEQQWIPPKADILLGPDAYRQRIRQIHEELHQGSGHSSNFERFFLAQVLWDETMAERVVKSLNQYPKALVVVLAGQGHIQYGDGIPQRVARRLKTPLQGRGRFLKQITVLLNPDHQETSDRQADYFWYPPLADGSK